MKTIEQTAVECGAEEILVTDNDDIHCSKPYHVYSFTPAQLQAFFEARCAELSEPVALLALKNTELSKRVQVLEDLLSSAYAIANRSGEKTHWQRYIGKLHINGISPVTPKTFRILPSDHEYLAPQPMSQEVVEILIKVRDGIVGNYVEGDDLLGKYVDRNLVCAEINKLIESAIANKPLELKG